MALIADAGHNLSDVLGLVLAWAGAALVKRRPSPRFSYGLKKSSILAALLNALLLLVAIGAIIAEALRRLGAPEPTNGATVMAVAAIGIVVNGVTAWLFARGRKHDLNIRGAYLHMAADAVVSVGVVVAGLLIVLTGKAWIDPVASLVVAVSHAVGHLGAAQGIALMTMAGVPKGIDPDLVERALRSAPASIGVHHLHIWPLSTTETALTVHIWLRAGSTATSLCARPSVMLHEMFGIAHSTIQVECAGHCPSDHDY